MTPFSSFHVLYLLKAAQWTLLLSLIAFIGGGVFGLAVALCRTSRSTLLRWLTAAYIQAIQGTPLLVILFLAYFGLSIAGFQLGPLLAAGIALTVYCAAFLGEIWRGCIQAVPKTQWEAAECLGLNGFQQLFQVILPQAARISVPPTVGFMVQIVKNTSLASVIGFVELSRAGNLVNNSTFQPFLVFTTVAFIYFCLCYPLSVASRRLERRLNANRH
jgi:polar amino acid transport system permease protein